MICSRTWAEPAADYIQDVKKLVSRNRVPSADRPYNRIVARVRGPPNTSSRASPNLWTQACALPTFRLLPECRRPCAALAYP